MNPRNGHVDPTVWYAPTGARGGAHFAPDGRGGGYAGYNSYHYPPHAYWGPDGTYGAHYQQVGQSLTSSYYPLRSVGRHWWLDGKRNRRAAGSRKD